MNKHIYIVGAGAIGKALAVFLKLTDKEVTLIRGSVDNLPECTETIQVNLESGNRVEAEIKISTLSTSSSLDGIVILTNKSFGNEKLAQALKQRISSSPVVLLQNGLGVEQPFIDNDFPIIYRCVLFATSHITTPDVLTFKPVAVSPIGVIKGTNEEAGAIASLLSSPVFKFEAIAAIQDVIWKKTIINCVFNSVCSLLEVDNGIFYRDHQALTIARRVIEECIVVSEEVGVKLTVDDVAASLLQISKASDGQIISTLQDIRGRKETEIDTLNFSILRIAQKFQLENRVRETRLLGELTRLKADLAIG
ncbi:ketopantoate reductase family protein [Telluribacter humicola]|uniref:ketopantoate reductase family protein n=1 Tax=Telluribacter humicola TaxID=1720261 RepID=UPI001A95A112|nr:2-dehydropantoate 2-reductase [Telluribacter humicola]